MVDISSVPFDKEEDPLRSVRTLSYLGCLD